MRTCLRDASQPNAQRLQTRAGRPNRASSGSAIRTRGSALGGEPGSGHRRVIEFDDACRPERPRWVIDRMVAELAAPFGDRAPTGGEELVERRRLDPVACLDDQSCRRGGRAWPAAAGRLVGPPVAGPVDLHRRPHVGEPDRPAGERDDRQAGGVERQEPDRPVAGRVDDVGAHVGFRKRRDPRQRRQKGRPGPTHPERHERHPRPGPVPSSNVSTRKPAGSSACTSAGSYCQWTKVRSAHRLRSHARRIGAGQVGDRAVVRSSSVRSSRGHP